MKNLFARPAAAPCLIAAGGCFALALLFRFALIGYGITALMFAFFGVVILCYLYLSRGLKRALTVLLVLGFALFVAAEIPVIRAAKGSPDVDADYVIILGAGVNGTAPSLSMLNRLGAALTYLEAHPRCIAVPSGGQGAGEDITEAEAMAVWLIAHGIDEARIIREDRATNTLENLSYSLALIPDADTAAIAVVSSEYHLCRAQLMAASMGYTVYGIPAHTTRPFLAVNHFIREALGVVHFRIFGT